MKLRKRKLKNTNNQKGITLIALVITIIVLLILAGVAVSSITGSDGVMDKAQNAKTATDNSNDEEMVKMAVVQAMADENTLGRLTWQNLSDALAGKATVPETDAPWTVTTANGTYEVDENGNVTKTGGQGGTVTVALNGITLNPASATLTLGGIAVQINAELNPEDTTETALTYTSANPNVVEVSETGLVTAVAIGDTTITVEGVNSIKAIFTVSVVSPTSGITQMDKKRTLSGATEGWNSKNPVIPKGFRTVGTWAYEEGSNNTIVSGWNDGLKITDNSNGTEYQGNEFVWVPCKLSGEANDLAQYDSYLSNYPKASSSMTSVSTDTTVLPVLDETVQIATYGGFWVARYEAGLVGAYSNSSNTTGTALSKKDTRIWNNVTYTQAATAAKNMINNETTKSGLVTGKQWDTIMKWFEMSRIGVTEYNRTVNGNSVSKQNWGTYNNVDYGFSTSGYYFTYAYAASSNKLSSWKSTSSRIWSFWD